MARLGISAAGLALLAGCSRLSTQVAPARGEAPPETRTLKLDHRPSVCVAPQYVAEELLRSEGFTDIRYIPKSGPKEIEPALASGEIDIAMHFAAPNVIRVEAGDQITILAGGHIGCFELFGAGQVRSIRDLKGKSVAVNELGGPSHVFLSSMGAYVGLNPAQDITWTTLPAESMQRLEAGTIDAFLGFPPEPQILRARGVGHTVVNSALDKPWSQYFCCMVTGNRELVQKHPVATKRAVRAILKAADLCAEQPEQAARLLVDKGMADTRRLSVRQSRRQFVQATTGFGLAVAGGSLLAGCSNQVVPFFSASSSGGPLETTRIRMYKSSGLCVAPQYLASDLLRAEGFTDVQYVETESADIYAAFARGDIDVSMAFVAPFIAQVDQDAPVVLLGGVHVGCFEVFGTNSVRTILDLKGKTVGVPGLLSAAHLFLSSIAAYVGIDPRIDINWLVHATADSAQMLADGTVDALMGVPPVPQELRAKRIGHVIVNSSVDRPWSQYFCCILAANREWAEKHPVAAKRGLRAILKATDVCATEPEQAAQHMVDGGFTTNYGYALQTMTDIPYNRWRDYDPEDTVRFFSLRLHEVGMIKSSPDQIISKGTNWTFFNEIKQELKV